ncbi:e3 binding domain protein, partial [Opisthorchis viverrini]
ISLSDVVGTGKAGRILKEDVLNLLNKGQPTAHETTIVASTPTSPSRPQVASTEEDEIVPLTTTFYCLLKVSFQHHGFSCMPAHFIPNSLEDLQSYFEG